MKYIEFDDNGDKMSEGQVYPEKSITFTICFAFDYRFWSTGCININIHSKEFEIEFLCFGIYIGKDENYRTND